MKSLWNKDGTPQKRFVYIFLNAKDRVIFPDELNKANVCSWVNLPPLAPGKGKLKLVFGNFKSSVTRNHRFNVEFQSGAYNYYSTDQLASVIAEQVPYETNRSNNPQRNFNFNQTEPIEIEADAKDLQNISLQFNFTIPVTTALPPSAIRPILDLNNRIHFVFKFEYD